MAFERTSTTSLPNHLVSHGRQLSIPGLVEFDENGDDVEIFLERVERRRRGVSTMLESVQRVVCGQFFTPSQAAELIASIANLPDRGRVRVLDPGAGIGSLTAALVARIIREKLDVGVSLLAVEIDPALRPHLEATLQDCRDIASAHNITLSTEAVTEDVVAMATSAAGDLRSRFDLVIMNPPYGKLAATSKERRILASIGINSPNLYTSFLAIGPRVLVPGGQLVAITPRSFANGPYFEQFRRFLLANVAIDHIHVFESRSTVFADSGVLQENIIFSATRGATRSNVTLSTSLGYTDKPLLRNVSYEEIVRPGDRRMVIHIPVGEADAEIAGAFRLLPCSLSDLDLEVSTGKVVDFRARPHLLTTPSKNSIPLIYPGNLGNGGVCWPLSIRKPQALAANGATEKLLVPNERFVLVKRFSSKEERRRVVAAVYEPSSAGRHGVGFENHLNVYHARGLGLDRDVAHGLCLWLNSSIVDRFFRTFSGHTQVNATDLRSMRYPSRVQLQGLGRALDDEWPNQEQIDTLVATHIFGEQPES